MEVNPRRDVKGKGVGKLDYIDSEIAVDCLANTSLFINEEAIDCSWKPGEEVKSS